MARPLRKVAADGYYHVLNRGNGRQDIFHKPADFTAFLAVLTEGLERYPVDLLCYCLMSNHWHLVLRPRKSDALGRLMGWVGVTHVRRHHQHYQSRGGGHLYQGRFKSFPIQDDAHFLTVCRYVEANPLRAGNVTRAERWDYSSLRWWARPSRAASPAAPDIAPPVPLAVWPLPRPADWIERVNRALKPSVLTPLRASANRGRPFGDATWTLQTAQRLGLGNTLRPPGRPKKKPEGENQKKAPTKSRR